MSSNCYFCKKPQAKKNKQHKKQTRQKNVSFCLSLMTWNTSDGFQIRVQRDMWQMTRNFSRHSRIRHGDIEVGNGQMVQIKGRGSDKLIFLDEHDNARQATAHELLYAPAMVGNLLSVRRLVESNLTVEFNKNLCEIKANGEQIWVPDQVWKLGHRNPVALRKMQADGSVDGLKIVECSIKKTCDTCSKGKLTRLPFPKKSPSESIAPQNLIHTDVARLMQTMSRNGQYYLVTFNDAYSRFTYVRLLKEKSEVENVCRNFIEMVKNKFEKRPKMIRLDRGGEYTGKKFQQYLRSEGIESHFTAGYSPQ